MFRRFLSLFTLLVLAFGTELPSAHAWSLGGSMARSSVSRQTSVLSQRGRRRPTLRTSSSAYSTSRGNAAALPHSVDPDADVSLDGRIVLLGTTSPVLGALKIFSNSEAIVATKFAITLGGMVTSVDRLMMYDHDGRLIGPAYHQSGGAYTMNLKTKSVIIPQREDYTFYARAVLKSRDDGGVPGELLQISSASIEGNGAWSNRSYVQSATGTFPLHETARSIITSVENVGPLEEALVAGSDRDIGAFRFTGKRGDGGGDLQITQLTFTAAPVGVSLSNIRITADGTSERISCSLASSIITCALPSSFGSLTSGPRVLKLLADIAVTASSGHTTLQISLNAAGDPLTPGAIRWTDGTETYDWVGGGSPVARGTMYR